MPGPFAAVVPSTADLQTKLDEWRDALTAADDGTKADTAFKDSKRAELEAMLTLQAENCAEIANGDLVLYLRTGYDAKDTQGQPTGELPAVIGAQLYGGGATGTLKIKWDVMEDAENFSVQVFSDPLNPDTSMIKQYTKPKIGKKKTKLEGLPSGQIVYARVRANGGSTDFGDWSDIAQMRVP